MKIDKCEEDFEVVIIGKDELQEGVAATGTALFQKVGSRWFACRIGWLWRLNRYGLPTRTETPSGYA